MFQHTDHVHSKGKKMGVTQRSWCSGLPRHISRYYKQEATEEPLTPIVICPSQ